jgi:SAM-dependent methyltransferase
VIKLDNNEYYNTNLKRWNELVDINCKSKFYNVDGFKVGKISLFPIEIKELGDVNGKSLLHLQCHFGLDTLSWARKGANVTGIDFSDKAIELATDLSREFHIPAEFIQANVYDIPKVIQKKFDIVYTSYGAICWLPDLYQWAKIINSCLKSGGIFYIIDNHPFGNLINEMVLTDFQVGYNYFTNGIPYRFENGACYSDEGTDIQNKTTYDWFHTMGEIINSLLDVGLRLEFLHEFPFSFFKIHPDMKRREDGYWEFQTLKHSVPMIFSLKARKE